MRKLKTKDALAFIRLIKATGIKEEFKSICKTSNKVVDAFDKGYELLWETFTGLSNDEAESALYKFLAGPFEMSPEEIENLELLDLLDRIKVVFDGEDMKSFFGSVRKMLESSNL